MRQPPPALPRQPAGGDTGRGPTRFHRGIQIAGSPDHGRRCSRPTTGRHLGDGSHGWACVQREQWDAPGYWEERGGQWHQMTLHGLRAVEENRPVTAFSLTARYHRADSSFVRTAPLIQTLR